MIKITKVDRTMGDIYITFQYDKDGQIFTQEMDAREIVERMKALKSLIERELTLTDLKDIIITLINEMREGKNPLLEIFHYENHIGVDLEG